MIVNVDFSPSSKPYKKSSILFYPFGQNNGGYFIRVGAAKKI